MSLIAGVFTLMFAWNGRTALAEAPPAASLTFQQANDHYRHGRFDEAASGYRRILSSGLHNGVLYYNLGNALLKSGKNGEALWAYLKANALLPRDADVQANLAYAQSLLQPGVNASVKPSRLIPWLSLRRRFETSELAGWSGLWVWLLVLAWSLSTWRPKAHRVARPLAWFAGIVAAGFVTALLVQTIGVDAAQRAVIVTERVEVKFSPQASGTTHFTLPEGALVRLIGREFGWAQVTRADGLTGWISERDMKAL